ncbi:MAG: hypothetical protein RSC92_04335 [Clostridia bacterium]
MKINIDKIFKNIETRVKNNEDINEEKKIVENKVNKPSEIEAKYPDIIATEQKNITEDIHGGEENAQEVENSNTNMGKENKNEDKITENKEFIEKQEKIIDDINFMYDDVLYNFLEKPSRERLSKEMLCIIKKIAKEHSGTQKIAGDKSYDINAITKHILTKELYKIKNDKYSKKDSKQVQFFIDTSGSNNIAFAGLIDVIKLLNEQGFVCSVADCGNGFMNKDMDDDMFGAKEKMKLFTGAKPSKIVRPSSKTAAKMAENSEFSIVLADFDGLSSICEMASMCTKDKVPYFISTEDRYTWDDPTEHDWVDPNCCYYPMDRIYDISYICNEISEEINEEYECDSR